MSAAPGGRANVRLCPDRSLFRKDIELCPSAPPSRGVRPISGHSPLWASHAKIVDCRSDERDGLTNGRERFFRTLAELLRCRTKFSFARYDSNRDAFGLRGET